MAWIAHPSLLILAEVAAGTAHIELTVQTLELDVDQELKGLKTANAVGFSQAGSVSKQLSFDVLSLNLGFQFPGSEQENPVNSLCLDFIQMVQINKANFHCFPIMQEEDIQVFLFNFCHD